MTTEKHSYLPDSSNNNLSSNPAAGRSPSPQPPQYLNGPSQQQTTAPMAQTIQPDHPQEYYQNNHQNDKAEVNPQAQGQSQQGQQYQTAVPLASIGMSPAPVDCPACHQRRLTKTIPVTGNTTHACAFATCCLTLCLCWIPYMMSSLKDVQHRCGNCGVHLATWHKSGQVEVLAHA